MKAIKYAAYAAGGLAVLAVIAAIAVAALFDPNKYRGEIESWVKANKNRTLKIDGDIKLAFWPSVGAKLGKVSLSERGSGSEFASLESAHVSVALLPLLRGEAIVDAVKLAGLRASVVKGKDGKFNFDDLLEAEAGAKPAARTDGGKPAKFDVSGVHVERAALSYRDAASGAEYTLSDLDLRTGRIADDVPVKLDLSANLKGKTPPLEARFDASLSYRMQMEKQAYAVSRLHLNVKGKLGADAFEAKLAVPEIAIAADRADGDAIGIDLSLAPADGGSVKASLSTALKADLKARVVDLATLAATIMIANPKMPQKQLALPFSGSARVDYGKESLSAQLGTKFDDSTVQAKLGMTRFAQPSYSFDVSIDKLDLDRYLPPQADAAKPAAGGGDTPVDLSALKGLSASGRIQIGALQVRRVKLANLKAELRLANGALQVSPLSANLYEGSLAGGLTLNASGNQVAVKQTLSGISIGPLVRDLAQRDAIEGKGNVALDLNTAGPSVNAMKKALAGSARVQLKDGAVKGIDIAETLRKAKSALGSKSASQGADKSQKTDFSEMSASFAIKGGVAHNEDLSVKAPLIRLGGAGDIDIGASTLDYLAKASVVATSKGQGGADLGQLSGLTIPVRLTGPFDAPKYEIDYGAMAAGLAKSRIADKLGEALGGKPAAAGGSSGGSARDKLRGLLGR